MTEGREEVLCGVINEALYEELIFESRQHLNDKEPACEDGGKSTGVEITSEKTRIKDDCSDTITLLAFSLNNTYKRWFHVCHR